ncbi:MAG: hypothetical protein AB1479_02585 [Pseudomonadota bacterium]
MSFSGGHGLVAENEAIRAYLYGLLDAEPQPSIHPPIPSEQGWRRFRRGRLWLALPRHRVLAVTFPPHLMRPLPDAPEEVLGSAEWGARKLLVLDPSVIMDDRGTRPEGLFWHGVLVVLDGGWWALACDDEGDEWTALPEGALLREGGASRPWLAGVHPDSATVLIHPDGLTTGLRS